MLIAKEDITPGHYWVRSRKNAELSIVQVAVLEIIVGCPGSAIMHHGREVADDFETAVGEFDFIARIEPPEDV